MFKGCIVALVTPFEDGQVDERKLRELVNFQLDQGIHGIAPCGCTGEAFSLTIEERMRIIQVVVEEVRGRVPVIPGTGSSSTALAIEMTREARRRGADGVLVITPFGNKPNPEGQYRHYEAIAQAVDVPIVLYNVPSRTGLSMSPETVARLSRVKNVVAIKEASGSLDQVTKIRSLCDITVLSGDDSLTLPMLSVGGEGVICTVANLVPRDMVALIDAFNKGDLNEAQRIHLRLFPLIKAIFVESNPIPLKAAMRLTGMLNGELRLPLAPISEANETVVERVLRDYGLV